MNFEKLTAYELVREEELSDIHSRGTILRHKKSGARIMLIENEDENKVFHITFRTTPKNSTGVAHIMEHSVLCGSREFPLKDPFVELVKGSLNTFLNAMTFPDKTCYPVASCNDQDFQNLMHIYLDAVFYPNIYRNDMTFRQEGWNYHLEDADGPLTYNGVVYNEMKGALSSGDDLLDYEIKASLFPDNTYVNESGGDPKNIPELTYEEFLDFHRTYYHPSNSFLYLYGNMNMEEKLAFLDEHYLSQFDALEVHSEIEEQQPFDEIRNITERYPVSDTESEKENTYLSWNVVTGSTTDPLLCTALDVLDYALMGAQGAPLRQALLDAEIGKDVYGSFEDGILQPFYSIVVKGSDPEKKDEFLRIIQEQLQKAVQDGVNPKAIEAAINAMEFRYREADYSSYPKGLIYGLDILETWLYSDENPFAYVKQAEVYTKLRKKAAEGYFEQLITDYFLNNTHGSVVVLLPEKGLTAKRDQELAEKLEAFRASLSREEQEMLVNATKLLEAFQEEEEDPENLKKIPMLKRSDIRREARKLTNEELTVEDQLLLYHEVQTNGIGYLDVMFELPVLSEDEVHTLGFLKKVFGLVDTQHFSYGELANEINANSGGISFGVETFEDVRSGDGFRVMFSVRAKALYPKLSFLFAMMKEILTTSVFSDTKRLREILSQVKSRLQGSIVSAGHGTAVLRAESYASEAAAFHDELSGIGYYQFVEELEKHFEERKDDLGKALTALRDKILAKNRMIVSYTGERDSLEEIQKQMKELLGVFPAVDAEDAAEPVRHGKWNEGFTTSGQVQYVAQTGNFREKGLEYSSALDILKVILSYDYLWNHIRVKGGAYGCMSGFSRSGVSYFASYRDPHMKQTLEVYRGIPQYLREFTADEREMTKYIIGTISGKDVPRTPHMQGEVSKSAYFSGISQEMLQKERDQILEASMEDIRALADIVEAVLSDDQICVVGSETVLERDRDVLAEVKPLIRS